MTKKPGIDVRELINKIETITRDRMAQKEVVSIGELRKLQKNDPKTLLIIEDDESMRAALRRIFEGEGYIVKTAADGTQLSAVVGDSLFDLILMDVGLPWINGLELAQLLKAHEDLKNIPLIFVSGRTSEEDIKRGFAVGADDYITKPFDIHTVQKSVRTLIKLHAPKNS